LKPILRLQTASQTFASGGVVSAVVVAANLFADPCPSSPWPEGTLPDWLIRGCCGEIACLPR